MWKEKQCPKSRLFIAHNMFNTRILYFQAGYQKKTQPHMAVRIVCVPPDNILKIFAYFEVRLQGHTTYV
jgi:hypothetical protein